MMKVILVLGILLNVCVGLFGLYNALSPETWPLRTLPPGMGTVLVLIGGTMGLTLKVVDAEREARASERTRASTITRLAEHVTVCMPSHEREFYMLWSAQAAVASNNVDITHLGPRRPTFKHGDEEQQYFSKMKKICAQSKARFRRVERWTPEKREWIEELIQKFEGVTNFSLAVLKDPSTEEMPWAVSVCRVDDRYAWLVAMVEHKSSVNHRDLLLTGRDAVRLVAQYFQDRLWARSVLAMQDGVEQSGWREKLES